MNNPNYFSTFIEVADDCPVTTATIPAPRGGTKTMPLRQYEMIARHPYKHTQEDVLFRTYADQAGIPAAARPVARRRFFAKGQPCLRSSALGKRYGWGFHFDAAGRVALYAMESQEYRTFAGDPRLTHVKAMRSKRA